MLGLRSRALGENTQRFENVLGQLASNPHRVPLKFLIATLLLLGLSEVLSLSKFDSALSTLGPWHAYIPRISDGASLPSLIAQVQATITGIVLPIAIAFITFSTERGAKSPSLKLFLQTSAAPVNVYSGVALILACLLFVLRAEVNGHEIRGFFIFLMSLWLLSWFLVNALLASWFVFATMRFLDPEVRSQTVIKAAINAGVSRSRSDAHLTKRYASWLSEAEASGLLAVDHSFLDENPTDLSIKRTHRFFVSDVYVSVLSFMLKRLAKKTGGRPIFVRLDFGPASFFEELVPIRVPRDCVLSPREIWLVRLCFRTTRLHMHHELKDLSRIGASLLSEANAAMTRGDVYDYDLHLETWQSLLSSVLDAREDLSGIIDTNTLVRDAVPLLRAAVSKSLGGEKHYLSQFLRQLRRSMLFVIREGSVSEGTLAASRPLIEVAGHAYYLLQYSWALRGASTPVPALKVADPKESAVIEFVERWEETGHLGFGKVLIKAAKSELSSVFRFTSLHLFESAKYVFTSAVFGDEVGFRWWIDSLNKWLSPYEYTSRSGYLADENRFSVDEAVMVERLDRQSEGEIFGADAVSAQEKFSALVSMHADTRTILAAALVQKQFEGGLQLPLHSVTAGVDALLSASPFHEGGRIGEVRALLDNPLRLLECIVRLLSRNEVIKDELGRVADHWETYGRRWVSLRGYSSIGEGGAHHFVGGMAELLARASRGDWAHAAETNEDLIGWLLADPESSFTTGDRALESLQSYLVSFREDGVERIDSERLANAIDGLNRLRIALQRRVAEQVLAEDVDGAYLDAIGERCMFGISEGIAGLNPTFLRGLGPVLSDPTGDCVDARKFSVSLGNVSRRGVARSRSDGERYLESFREWALKLTQESVLEAALREMESKWVTIRSQDDLLAQLRNELPAVLQDRAAILAPNWSPVSWIRASALSAQALRFPVHSLASLRTDLFVVPTAGLSRLVVCGTGGKPVNVTWTPDSTDMTTGVLRAEWFARTLGPSLPVLRISVIEADRDDLDSSRSTS